MGGKRRRSTAKTGDKALYKARNTTNSTGSSGRIAVNEDDENNIYDNEVDRFHRDKQKEEFLKLDQDDSSGSEEEEQEEAVMNLGVGGSSDEESSSDDDDDDDLPKEQMVEEESSDDSDKDDDDNDDDDEEEPEDVRDWGKRKAFYYHGDTADLEIGQNQEDALLEEEAAKEIQAARYQDMAEEDFAIDDDDEAEFPAKARDEKVSIERNIKNLSRKEKQKLLDKQHPEFLPLLSHFTPVVQELKNRTLVATSALLEGDEGAAEAVGASRLGQQFLVTKALIQTATALNLASYLLLKSEQPDNMASHPVMSRLQKLHKFAQQLESSVEQQVPGLSEQLDNLVKAAALMNGDNHDEDSDDVAESSESDHGIDDTANSSSDEDEAKEPETEEPQSAAVDVDEASSSSDSSSSDHASAEDRRRRQVLNEARFGLRPKELLEEETFTSRMRRPATDFEEDAPGTQVDVNAKALASTLNSIQQRTTKQQTKSQMAEDLDDFLDRDDHSGEHMPEYDFPGGKAGDTDDDEDAADPELEDGGDEGDFYSQVARKSQSRKVARKAFYQVAPKYPRVENEVEGERAVTKKILKNRGLVAHKARLNRNPRVKKREQYRKALIRRKGAVREVRKDEGHKYGGEETGIKSGLSRSRKL